MGTFRKTKSVMAMLQAFEQCKTAISTLDLVERFDNQMNKSTVYRILDRLEGDGTLHSFIGNNGIKWYALQDASQTKELGLHPHFQCTDCGKTECLPINISIPDVKKYSIESASILLVGKCEKCAS